MRRIQDRLLMCLVCAAAALVPIAASAQGGASVSGVVTDSSASVLPGVSVEAESSALAAPRTATTDSAGRYTLVDLRPGTYVITFTLTGFQTVRREGVVLQGSFAAQVSVRLGVGAIQETITVSAASPVVDVQNVRNELVTTKAMLEMLPASRQQQSGLALVPGVVSYNSSSSAPGVQDFYINTQSVRGSPTGDSNFRNDGMATNSMMIGTGSQAKSGGINDLAQEEIVYDAGGISAEYSSSGVRSDSIPKEGANRASGTFRGLGQAPSWQTSNLTTELAKSISAVNKIDFNWEVNAGVGGPIIKNKAWFFSAFRLNQFELLATDQFFPDGRQAGSGGHVNPNGQARITLQPTPRNKIGLTYQGSTSLIDRYDFDSRTSPEAGFSVGAPVNWSGAAKWTSPLTSRLLVDIGQSFSVATYQYKYQPSVGPFDVSKFNASTGLRTVATNIPVYDLNQTANTVGNISYVTGSHALKSGVNFVAGTEHQQNQFHGHMAQLNFVNINGVQTPASVTVVNGPIDSHNDVKGALGLYVQDKWSVNRLTIIAGGRYDRLRAEVPAQALAAGNFVPARVTPLTPCTPCWTNWSARASASYDLFGNGKTAVKGAVGKYVASALMSVAASVNAMRSQTDTRAWTDLDGNGRALDANGAVQYAEIGPSGNSRFGLPAGSTRFDASTPRPVDWEESILLQHELMSNVSVSAGYYHHSYAHLSLIRNVAVDPNADFTPFTIVGPSDPRLPNGGGESIAQYNLVPSKFGASDRVSTFSEANARRYHGFEVAANARLPKNGFAFGSVTTERIQTNDCDVVNNDPNNRRFCSLTMPFRPLFKVAAGASLPYSIQLSGSVQVRPGAAIPATYTYTSALAGVTLTGGGTRSVNLANPTELFYPYIKSVDARFARTFRFGARRAQAFLELYNLPNMSTVLQVNTAYGANWLRPTVITQARRFQIGGQFDF